MKLLDSPIIEIDEEVPLSEEDQKEYDRIMSNRIRLRCTNKKCELSTGFFLSKTFKEYFLNEKPCILCKSKHAEEINIVN